MAFGSEIIRDVGVLDSLAADWDVLAAGNGLPMSTWEWASAWWAHMRPERAQPRVVVVRDGERIVAIAPYFVHDPGARRLDYRLMGSGTLGLSGILGRPGAEWAAAESVAAALAAARPRPGILTFEGISLRSPWPAMLRERWPGDVRPSVFRPMIQSAPSVSLRHPSFDAWLGSRSSNFRGQMRRMRRNLEKAGGRIRTATAGTLRDDLKLMFALHAGRWDGRGRSAFTDHHDGLVDMFARVGRTALADHRLELQIVEVEGVPVAIQLFASAGSTMIFWNGGWDERFARFKPAVLALLAAIEAGIGRGLDRLDLGAGGQPYKLRLADGDEPYAWGNLVVPGRRVVTTSASLAAPAAVTAAKRLAKRKAQGEQLERLKNVYARLRRM